MHTREMEKKNLRNVIHCRYKASYDTFVFEGAGKNLDGKQSR